LSNGKDARLEERERAVTLLGERRRQDGCGRTARKREDYYVGDRAGAELESLKGLTGTADRSKMNCERLQQELSKAGNERLKTNNSALSTLHLSRCSPIMAKGGKPRK